MVSMPVVLSENNNLRFYKCSCYTGLNHDLLKLTDGVYTQMKRTSSELSQANSYQAVRHHFIVYVIYVKKIEF